MSPTAQTIMNLIDAAAPMIPVIFSGNTLRTIATLEDVPDRDNLASTVDPILFSQRLSAEKISTGKIDGKFFILAH